MRAFDAQSYSAASLFSSGLWAGRDFCTISSVAICLPIRISNRNHVAIYFILDFLLLLSCFGKAKLARKSQDADPTFISHDKVTLQIYRPKFISMMIVRLFFCRSDARTYAFSTFHFSNNLFSIDEASIICGLFWIFCCGIIIRLRVALKNLNVLTISTNVYLLSALLIFICWWFCSLISLEPHFFVIALTVASIGDVGSVAVDVVVCERPCRRCRCLFSLPSSSMAPQPSLCRRLRCCGTSWSFLTFRGTRRPCYFD